MTAASKAIKWDYRSDVLKSGLIREPKIMIRTNRRLCKITLPRTDGIVPYLTILERAPKLEVGSTEAKVNAQKIWILPCTH